jgi:hypothetical protein
MILSSLIVQGLWKLPTKLMSVGKTTGRQSLLFLPSAGGRQESFVGRSRFFFLTVTEPSSSLVAIVLLMSSPMMSGSDFTVTRDFGFDFGFVAGAMSLSASSRGSSLTITRFWAGAFFDDDTTFTMDFHR